MYSLIILFVMLTVVLAMSAVNINERNNAGATGNSVQAFQTANSGSELFAKVMTGNPATVGAIATAFGGCNAGTGNLTGNISGGGTYTIELLKSDGTTQVNCSSDAALSANTIASIKSTGTFSGSSRAIQVAMAAGICKIIKGTDSISSSLNKTISFPASSFTAVPTVLVTPTSTSPLAISVTGVSASQFTVNLAASGSQSFTWVAFDSLCSGTFTVN